MNLLGITDADSEDTSNSVVKLICDEISSPEACETFDLKVQGLPGDYRGMYRHPSANAVFHSADLYYAVFWACPKKFA